MSKRREDFDDAVQRLEAWQVEAGKDTPVTNCAPEIAERLRTEIASRWPDEWAEYIADTEKD